MTPSNSKWNKNRSGTGERMSTLMLKWITFRTFRTKQVYNGFKKPAKILVGKKTVISSKFSHILPTKFSLCSLQGFINGQ